MYIWSLYLQCISPPTHTYLLQSSSSTPVPAEPDAGAVEDRDKAIETAIGESISDFNPSQFASMLEETISKMDKQLE